MRPLPSPREYRTAHPPARSGFTLIEVLMVLVILGILATIAGPRIDLHRFTMNGAARAIGSSLLRAQRMAVQKQHPVVVTFDIDGNRLRVHEDLNGNLLIDPDEPVRYEPVPDGARLGRAGAPSAFPGGDDITFSHRQGGLPAVVFYRDGSASEEGGFHITSARAMSDPAYSVHARAVEVQRSTGKLLWHRLTDRGWEVEEP